MSSRGRRPLHTDETVLDAALASFAALGYTATSVRSLNTALGLSHEAITQRFGPKPALFRAAVRHGLARFVADFDEALTSARPSDDLERLRAIVRAFMVAAARHPNLGELLHQGDLGESERAALTSAIGLDSRVTELADLLARLRRTGSIVDVSVRELWFLVHAGAAPMHYRHVSSVFDRFDGPLDDERHIEHIASVIVRGLVVDDARSQDS